MIDSLALQPSDDLHAIAEIVTGVTGVSTALPSFTTARPEPLFAEQQSVHGNDDTRNFPPAV